jgi:hypothetical protein
MNTKKLNIVVTDDHPLVTKSLKDIFDRNILTMCNVEYSNFYEITLSHHAMCFYNFEFKNKNYLIFSNSGKGIHNCNLDSSGFTNNKLYYYDKDFDINLFITFIYTLSLHIWEITYNNEKNNKTIDQSIDQLDLIYPKHINAIVF